MILIVKMKNKIFILILVFVFIISLNNVNSALSGPCANIDNTVCVDEPECAEAGLDATNTECIGQTCCCKSDYSWTGSTCNTAPTVNPVIKTSGTCALNSQITVQCPASDSDGNLANVKLWIGECNKDNCFNTRSWSAGGTTYSNGETISSPYSKTITISQTNNGIAATCQATDSDGATSGWGDVYPLCSIPSNTCSGTAPTTTSGTTKGLSSYLSGYTPSSWTYSSDATTTTPCKWKCASGYTKSGNGCIVTTYTCSGTAPTTPTGTIKGVSTYTAGYTPTSWTYSSDATLATACKWKCDTGYVKSGNGCVPITVVNGQCGTADGKTYSYSTTSWGIDTICDSGTSNPASPSFPDQGATTTWSCVGSNGGSTVDCSASRESPPPPPSYETSCTDGVDNDNDGYLDKEDASCVEVTSITAPSVGTKGTPFTVTCGITSTNKPNCVGAKLNGDVCTFTSWSGTNPQLSCISSTAGTKTVQCYISNKADGSCVIGTDNGIPPSSSKSKLIIIEDSSCSGKTESQCTGECKWCDTCNTDNNHKYTGTDQCIELADTCLYSCSAGECNAECDNNNGEDDCNLSTCLYSCSVEGASCSVGSCCQSQGLVCNTIDPNTGTSHGSPHCCKSNEYWKIDSPLDNKCTQFEDVCSPACNQPSYVSGCVKSNKIQACCNIPFQNDYSRFWRNILVIDPE